MIDQKYIILNYNVSTDDLELYREIFQQVKYLAPRVYNHTSRYTTLRRIQSKKDGKIYHENWVKKIIDISPDDSYFVVTVREEGRLDMIANDYYNSPKFWWVLALANDIIDPFDLKIGTRLRIPPLLSLYNKGGVLSADQ
jgi:hypothetical protein